MKTGDLIRAGKSYAGRSKDYHFAFYSLPDENGYWGEKWEETPPGDIGIFIERVKKPDEAYYKVFLNGRLGYIWEGEISTISDAK